MGWRCFGRSRWKRCLNGNRQRPTPGQTGVTSSAEERARSGAFESLRLSRSRILDQLSRATNPAHRKMLESALQSINLKCGEIARQDLGRGRLQRVPG